MLILRKIELCRISFKVFIRLSSNFAFELSQ